MIYKSFFSYTLPPGGIPFNFPFYILPNSSRDTTGLRSRRNHKGMHLSHSGYVKKGHEGVEWRGLAWKKRSSLALKKMIYSNLLDATTK